MWYIDGKDTVRGTDGWVKLYVGDEEYNFFHITDIQISMEIGQDEVPRIGTRTVGHKTSTITISGSMTGYYGDPVITREMTKYVHGGAYPDMKIELCNFDPDTQAATQTFIGTGLMITNVPLAMLVASDTMMTADYDFTLENYTIKDEFNETIPLVEADQIQPH